MSDTDTLLALLRHEYSVTNQQFTHVLASRVWGDFDIAERIVEIDNVDFANGMAIAGHLVSNRMPVRLAPDCFAPGVGQRGVLEAEQQREARITAFLDTARCADETAAGFLQVAREPRAAYAVWLNDRLGAVPRDQPEPSVLHEDIDTLAAHLITLLEQASVHAYVHRYHGSRIDADAAWMTSGKAMMHLTSIVHHAAVTGALPRPGLCPEPLIGNSPMEAVEADNRMASACAQAARIAAACTHQKLAGLCETIATYCDDLAVWKPGRTHPAEGNIPSIFTSFEASLDRMAR